MPQYKSIEYKFRDRRMYEDYVALGSLGFEYWRKPAVYRYDCRTSTDRICVFQYTISGEGAVVLDNRMYSLHPGQAFLIEKPGPFSYYLPEHSDHWEFKFISLGLSGLNVWRDITQRFGRIITLRPDSEPIKYWDRLYEMALNNQLTSFFQTSAYAYEFMMKLMEVLHREAGAGASILQNCIELIQTNYQEDISLESLADACSVSPSYLSRKFKQSLGVSPIQFLIKHRVDIASSLLLRGNQRIDEVARAVGFKDANYFARIFRRYQGVSPTQYRETECVRKVEDSSISLEVHPGAMEDARTNIINAAASEDTSGESKPTTYGNAKH